MPIRLHIQNNGSVKEKRRVPGVPTDETQCCAHATCQRVSNKKVCRRPRVRQPVIKNPLLPSRIIRGADDDQLKSLFALTMRELVWFGVRATWTQRISL